MRLVAFWILVIISVFFLFYSLHNDLAAEPVKLSPQITEASSTGFIEHIEIVDRSMSIIHQVNFISQAPRGNWKDPRQEDGCEEASAVMAVNWANDITKPSALSAEQKIIDISNWEKKYFGVYKDTSVSDTAERIMKNYLGFDDFEIKNNITTQEIKDELYSGNVAMIAVDGTKLNNPNFKRPGPKRHMILIIGYDPTTENFIANDPGTRHGANYRYSEKIIESALRDYPTSGEPAFKQIEKNMVVIKKRPDIGAPNNSDYGLFFTQHEAGE